MMFREEDFIEICEHLERLHKIANLLNKFHGEGITKDDLRKFLNLLKEAIEHSTGKTELLILHLLNVLEENVDKLFITTEKISFKRIKSSVPPEPIFPRLHKLRFHVRKRVASSKLLKLPEPLPPPPTLHEILEEMDALATGFANELIRHTKILITLFDIMKPESIPHIINLIRKNPGHVRSSLGEPLCIWWLGRVLADERKNVWCNVKGPVKICDVEIDAISVCNNKIAVAEIKLTNNKELLEEACNQVISSLRVLSYPNNLRQIGFVITEESYKFSEIAILTLYNLNSDIKRYVENILGEYLEKENFIYEKCVVYDINDILSYIKKWRSRVKNRYKELFETLNKVLETT